MKAITAKIIRTRKRKRHLKELVDARILIQALNRCDRKEQLFYKYDGEKWVKGTLAELHGVGEVKDNA